MSSKGIDATEKLAEALGVGASGDAKAVVEEPMSANDGDASTAVENAAEEVADGPLASVTKMDDTSEADGNARSEDESTDGVADEAADGP